MTGTYFLIYLLAVVVATGVVLFRYLGGRGAMAGFAGLLAWLVYVGTLSYFGVAQDPDLRPPGIFLIVLPVFFFVALVLARSAAGLRIATAIPAGVILGFQSFRVGVELLLHRLWTDGLVPKLMTYEGGNADIFVGLSAPIAAWLAGRGRGGVRAALAWNAFGLLALINIILRSALTAPGPLPRIASETPNLAIGTFPFTYIAGFFAPLAMALHVLAIRALRSRLRNETAATGGIAQSGQPQQSGPESPMQAIAG